MYKIKSYFPIFFALFTFCSLTSDLSFAARAGTADQKWKVLQTQHFNIMHVEGQLDLGLYYAQISEEAYSHLNSVFGTLPEKISLVISDNTDSSNGYATIFPYPMIYAFPVQVGNHDSLSEAGDWPRELITHELTHIAQLYPYGPNYRALRTVFGSIISPLLLTPNWWKEGMAVEMETQFSPRGRTRSYIQDAQIRAYVAMNKLTDFSLAEANENLITWPYGNRPYFFGSMIMSQISKTGTKESIGKIVQNQTNRLPYNINTAPEEILNSDYVSLYSKTLYDYSENAKRQLQTINSLASSNLNKIAPNLIQSRTIKIHPRFNIIAFLGTDRINTSFYFYSKQDAGANWSQMKLEKVPDGNISSFDFHPEQKKIAFSKVHAVNWNQEFSDIFIYDIEKCKTDQLTFSERVRDPIYSSDGQNLLYLKVGGGKTELFILDINNKKATSLVKNSFSERINSYTFLSSDEVLFTSRNSLGIQSLYSVNIKTKRIQKINAPNGISFIKYIKNKLYFISTENEVLNVYQAQLKNNVISHIQPITHLQTGTIDFSVNPDQSKVYTNIISENGPFVSESEFFTEKSSLPKIENEILYRYENASQPLKDIPYHTHDYSFWSHFYPHYWIPFINTNENGNGVLYQAMTSSSDPVGFHSYSAQLNYDSYNKKMGYALNYVNQFWDWPVQLSALQTQQLFGIDSYVQKNQYLLGTSPNTFSFNQNTRFSFGALLDQTSDPFLKTNHLGGYAQAVYNNIEQKPYQYYPMSGANILLRYQSLFDQKNLDNSRYGDYSQAILSYDSYHHLFLPDHHVIKIKLDGLYTFQDVANRFGSSNSSLPGSENIFSKFILRGYQAGQFLGAQMYTANAEYHFPVYNILSGSGTTPFYLKYMTGAFTLDALGVKGIGLNKNDIYESMKISNTITSAGLEINISSTLGYVLPLNLVYGVYHPLNKDFAKDQIVSGLSIQLGGL